MKTKGFTTLHENKISNLTEVVKKIPSLKETNYIQPIYDYLYNKLSNKCLHKEPKLIRQVILAVFYIIPRFLCRIFLD